jgi:hypothetical protein
MRPVLTFGLTADGVHRYLYGRADQGVLFMYPRFAAAEYGLSFDRFSNLFDALVADGRLALMGTHASRLAPYTVKRPADYHPESDKSRKLRPEDFPDAIDLFESLSDELLDKEDEIDYPESDSERYGERPQVLEVEGNFPWADRHQSKNPGQ